MNKWLRHETYKLALVFISFWTPLILFFKIAGEIVEREPIVGDVALLNWLHRQASPSLDFFLFAATTIGGVIGMTVITTTIALYFLHKHQIRKAITFIACVGGVVIANLILKALFQRERPSLFESLVVENTFSFPSGHAMTSSALALCLILLYWNTRWRWPVTIAGLALALIIGISRPYFGVHYPSDIIAGWCASIAWVVLVFFVTDRISLRRGKVQTTKLGK